MKWRVLVNSEFLSVIGLINRIRGTICISVPYSKFWGSSPCLPRDLHPRFYVRLLYLVKIRVSYNRGEMYIVHGCLSLCLCVCLPVPRHITTLMHGPGCNLGEW